MLSNKYFKDMKMKLMKTRNIPLADIDNEYIEKLTWRWDDVSELILKIPSRIMVNGKIKDNFIFNQFKCKRQQLIMSNPDIRFVMTESSKKEKFYKLGKEKHNYIEKTLVFKSYEYTLKEANLVLTEDIVRQLYKKDSLDISEGILDIFEKEQPWTIGRYSTDLNTYEDTILKANELSLTTKSISGKLIDKGTLLFSQEFNLNPYTSNDCVEIEFTYSDITRVDNNTTKSYTDSYMKNKLNNLPYVVKKVEAYYDKSPMGRYSIKYTITYDNGFKEDRYCDFLFCDKMNLTVRKIGALYTNGQTVKTKAIKYRTLTQGTYNWLDLIRNNIALNYGDLYFKFDTVNFVVDVYKKSEFGQKSNIVLSYDNFIKDINKKDIMEDIVSSLNICSDLVSIADVNPYQNNTIYNYDYFIRKGMMSDELKTAWNKYNEIVNSLNGQAFDIRSTMNTYNKLKIKQETQRAILENNINLLQIRRTDYISRNKKQEFNKEINVLSTQINTHISSLEKIMGEIEKTKTTIANLEERLELIYKQADKNTCKDSSGNLVFTKELLLELSDITIEETVRDDIYIVSKELYEHYYQDLALRNKNPIEFTTNISGLVGSRGIKIPKKKNIIDYITLGTFFNIEGDDEVILDERGLRLVEISIVPNKSDIVLTLTNRDKQNEKYSGVSGLSKTIDKANAYINNYKQLWNESYGYNDFLNKVLSEGMDLRATSIRGRNNRVKFDFTEAGLYIIDAYNEDSQIYLGAGMVCFTKDRWLTCSTALDTDGLVAKNIYGELILGKKLVITSENGDFIIGDVDKSSTSAFGLQVYEGDQMRIFLGTEIESDGLRHAKLVLYDPSGKEVVLSDKGILQTNQFVYADNVDSSHPANIPYRAIEGCEKFKNVILTVDFYHYRAYEKTAKSISQQTSNSSSISTSESGGGGTSGASSITTTEGSGKTSTDGVGSHKHVLMSKSDIVFSDANVSDHYYRMDCNGRTTGNTDWGEYYFRMPLTFFGAPGTTPPDYFYTGSAEGAHSHSIGSHTHGMEHTHTIGSHSHGMSHTHTINGHGHDLDYGIFEDPATMTTSDIWVNHKFVKRINSGQSVDISEYLNINTMNLIEVTSACNGRIVANIASKYWQKW